MAANPAGLGADAARIEVLLLDTIGDLENFYAAADVAFVGGSLVPIGGHNLLEPAALGVATLSGESQGNAPDVARLLIENAALRVVHDADSLGAAVVELLGDEAARSRMARAAQATLEANRGALDAALAMIRACLAGRAE